MFLKILVPNNLIGRIIGKGNTVKRIMQDIETNRHPSER